MYNIPNNSVLKYILEPVNGSDPFTDSPDDLLHVPILGWTPLNSKYMIPMTLNGTKESYIATTKDDTRYKVIDGCLTEVN